MKSFVTIICPVLDERESIGTLVDELMETLGGLEKSATISGYEIIFIDDGSSDGTYELLKELCDSHPVIGMVRFRTNMGKSAALSHGFHMTKGDVVITMDGDLQDDPAEIPKFLLKLEEGFHLVSGWKAKRHDPITKTAPSRLYNWATRKASGIPLHDFNCGFKAYRREVVEEINVYGQLHRFLPVLAHWRGFRVGELPVNHRPRRYGKSKFGAARFAAGMLDFMTVIFLMKYRRRPLHLFGLVGLALFFIGLVVNAYLGVVWLQTHAIGGRPLLTFGLLSTILGFQFISIGLLGEMMVHMTKDREQLPIEAVHGLRGNKL